jgi:hypothetical protein
MDCFGQDVENYERRLTGMELNDPIPDCRKHPLPAFTRPLKMTSAAILAIDADAAVAVV